jgi:hypothetical protein
MDMGYEMLAIDRTKCDWAFLDRVNQGDAIFMSGQHRAVGRTADQPGKHDYFLPSDADKGTAVWVRWLEVPPTPSHPY